MIYLDLEFQDWSSWHSKTLQHKLKQTNGNKLVETSCGSKGLERICPYIVLVCFTAGYLVIKTSDLEFMHQSFFLSKILAYPMPGSQTNGNKLIETS
jgi:hypothetical protein